MGILLRNGTLEIFDDIDDAIRIYQDLLTSCTQYDSTYRFGKRPSRLVRKLRKLGNEPKRFLSIPAVSQIAQHRSWQQSLKLSSFLWVVACFAIAALYLGVIASDRYVSRAGADDQTGGSDQDAARCPVDAGTGWQQPSGCAADPGVPEILGSAGRSWIKSSASKAHYQSDKADYFSRLPQDVSREDFIEYYRNHLTLRLDELSGVLTIELQAFDPEYGQQVVGLMLKSPSALSTS